MQCPNCSSIVLPENINVATDVAQCKSCHTVFRLSEHLPQSAPKSTLAVDPLFDLNTPPKGIVVEEVDGNLVINSTTRSIGIAIFMTLFMTVWSGASLGGIYGTQIINGKFDLAMSLFGLPFLGGSILFWSIALMAMFGRVKVTINRNQVEIFTGIGKLGRTKVIALDDISKVYEKTTRGSKGGTSTSIALEGRSIYQFGRGLSFERQRYVLNALQLLVDDVKHNRNTLMPNLMQHLLH